MSKTLNWGILGTGSIAGIFARGLADSESGRLIAVGSRTQATADAFGERWQVPRRYGSYEQVLADPDVQIVYIATPHPQHKLWAIQAAEAGKHILCEKPLAVNYRDAFAMVVAADRHDIFLMEAFMYRCHPQTAKLLELIRSGIIGAVRVVQANFSFHADMQPEGRLFNPALGGGGILDVGGYCVSMARLIAGVAIGKDVADPLELEAIGHIGSTGVDEYTIAALRFSGDILAQLFVGIQVLGENEVRIFGSDGAIRVPVPWVPSPHGGKSSIFIKRNDEEIESEIVIDSPRDIYALEADTVAAYIEARQTPAMPWHDTLGNIRAMDLWRAALGLPV